MTYNDANIKFCIVIYVDDNKLKFLAESEKNTYGKLINAFPHMYYTFIYKRLSPSLSLSFLFFPLERTLNIVNS